MHIGLVTLLPEMFAAITEYGISGRAVRDGLISLDYWNPRDFTKDKHRTVDDKPFGGGPGMLMKTEPLVASIQAAKAALLQRRREQRRSAADAKPVSNGSSISHGEEESQEPSRESSQEPGESKVIFLSPQGKTLTQQAIIEFAKRKELVLVCGRYQGIDSRLLETHIDEEWSLGDFVLSGGEVAAMALIDAMIRFLPGALGDEDSARQDSFANGLLHSPEYTRPQDFDGQLVPEVLLSGNHGAIRLWRLKQSLGATWLKRPDLLEANELDQEQQRLLQQFIDEYRSQQSGE